jgi:hypothetical protein
VATRGGRRAATAPAARAARLNRDWDFFSEPELKQIARHIAPHSHTMKFYDISNTYITCTVRDHQGNIVNPDDVPRGVVDAMVSHQLGIPSAGFWESMVALGGIRRWGDEDEEDESTVKLFPPRRGRKFNGNRSRVRRFLLSLKRSSTS